MKKVLLVPIIFLLNFISPSTFAQEGTKQLMPNSTDNNYLNLYNTNTEPGVSEFFATESATNNPAKRMNIKLNAGEILHFGLKHLGGHPANQTSFRLKDPNGNIVFNRTPIPTTGTGYINTHAEAVKGPEGAILNGTTISNAEGYTPFTYNATVSGDYYIEFQTWDGTNFSTANKTSSNITFEFIDFTVTDGSKNIVTNPSTPTQSAGRLWARQWTLNTNGSSNPIPAGFDIYVFIDEGTGRGFVNRVNFDMNPFGYGLVSNSFGAKTTGTDAQKRQSSNSNTIATDPNPEQIAQHKIFFNNPDEAIFQDSDASAPIIKAFINNIKIYDYNYTRGATESERSLNLSSTLSNLKLSTACSGGDATFKIESNITGQAAIFLDINNDGDFTDAADVSFLQNIVVGTNTITWTGMKDGEGNSLTGLPITVGATATFLFRASTHFPTYDVEQMRNMTAEPIRPFTFNRGTASVPDNTATIFWDDTPISGTSQLSAGSTTARNNGSGFVNGNNRMLNTWANSVNLGLPSFNFEINSNTIIPDNKTVVADNNNICSGGTVTITVQSATAGVNYELRNASGTVVESITPETSGNASFSAITLTTTTTYNVYATTPGCTGSEAQMNGGASIPVNIDSPNTTVALTASTNSACIAEAVTLTISSAENTVNYQAYLDNASIASMGTGTGVDLTLTIPANVLKEGSNEIRVIATNTNNCSAELANKVTINVGNPPSSDKQFATQVCVESGQPASISIEESELGVNYQFVDDATGNTVGAAVSGTGETITLSSDPLTNPATFSVSATGTGACNQSIMFAAKVEASINEITLTVPEVDTISGGEETSVVANSEATNYSWSTRVERTDEPNDETIISGDGTSNITAAPTEDTWYIVVASDDKGCSRTDSVLVAVQYEIFIPSLFSPNSDGNNDIFRVTAESRNIQELDFRVFDRAGNLVYETQDAVEATTTGWNGKNNGREQPISNYIWVIDGTFVNGQPIEYQGKNRGEINLIR